jgi:hypothetical protein
MRHTLYALAITSSNAASTDQSHANDVSLDVNSPDGLERRSAVTTSHHELGNR